MKVDPKDKTKEEVVDEGIQSFKKFLVDIGVPVSLSEKKIKEADLDSIVDGVKKVKKFSTEGFLPSKVHASDIVFLG